MRATRAGVWRGWRREEGGRGVFVPPPLPQSSKSSQQWRRLPHPRLEGLESVVAVRRDEKRKCNRDK